jgi:hypothetical protein
MAVSSYANRYSVLLPSDPDGGGFLRAGLPLAAPAILLTFSITGAALAGVSSPIPPNVRTERRLDAGNDRDRSAFPRCFSSPDRAGHRVRDVDRVGTAP